MSKKPVKPRSLPALGMIISRKGGKHRDRRHEQDKYGCRGRAQDDQ